MPDENLVKLVTDLRSSLKSKDVCGLIILASTTHIEYGLQLEATWTCLRQEADGMVRVRSKREDYPSDEKQAEVLAHSVGILTTFIDASQHNAEVLGSLLKAIGSAGVSFDHTSTFEPTMGDLKAMAFDKLISDLSDMIPPECVIKKLAGLELAKALSDYVLVPKADWKRLIQ